MDKVRIKIQDKNKGDAVVYDNRMGASDDAAVLTTLGGGSIVVHDGKTKARMDYSIETESSAEVVLYPNPVFTKVTIDLKGMSAVGAKTILTDAVGKQVIQNAHKVIGDSLLEVDLSSGLYIIQFRMEGTFQVLKVIKHQIKSNDSKRAYR